MFKNKKGFTLAEALTALTVLGVLAAISLPVIITNYNDHANIAAQKAMNLDLTHAMQNLIAEDGRLNKMQVNAEDNTFGEGHYNTPNEAFVKEKLVNVLKIARTCNPGLFGDEADSIRKCGIKTGDDYLSFDRIGDPDLNFTSDGGIMVTGEFTAVAAVLHVVQHLYPISLANGASMFVLYNPACEGRNRENPNQPPTAANACVNIIYDVNGAKGPNQVGRDVGFFTAFYPTKTVFGTPVLYEAGLGVNNGGNVDVNATVEAAEQACSELAPNNKAGLPTQEEAASITINSILFEEDLWNIIARRGDINVTTPLLNQKSDNDARGPYICVHK